MIKTRACAANAPTDPEQISHSGILPAMKRSRRKSQVTIVTGSSDVQGSNVPHFYTPHGLPAPSNQFLCLGKISYLIFLKPFYFFGISQYGFTDILLAEAIPVGTKHPWEHLHVLVLWGWADSTQWHPKNRPQKKPKTRNKQKTLLPWYEDVEHDWDILKPHEEGQCVTRACAPLKEGWPRDLHG